MFPTPMIKWNFFLFLCFTSICIEAIPVTTEVSSSIPNKNSTRSIGSQWSLALCTSDRDCQLHGACKEGYCLCDYGWMTWKNSPPCTYKQSSKLLSFLVSFILGTTGMDWFILSRKDTLYILCGILKCLTLVGCCIWSPLAANSRNDDAKTVASCLSVILTLLSLVWWLVDWIRILFNAFTDGNGAPLI